MATVAPPGREVGLVRLPIDRIYPAPDNSLIYRPVSPDDPEIMALARSILDFGLRQPIVVTRNHVIVSGHRRHAACRLAGMAVVTCQVEPIDSDDPDFERLLCEYNRQRVKSFDEVVREQVIAANPDEAYRALLEHRRAASAVSGNFLAIGEVKRRKKISRIKSPMLEAVRRFVDAQRDYWPISDREVHYGLLNDPPLRNTNKADSRYTNDLLSYKDVTDVITRARLAGFIPFDAIADPTRTIQTWDDYRDVSGFLNRELKKFLKGYYRDLMQGQPNHVEIIGEKNTIAGSIRDVSMRYCIPYTLGRGYCSLDPRHKMYRRFKASGKRWLIILIMSDFDPEGEDIAHSFARSMRDDFGIEKIRAMKVCLTWDQVRERDLPQQFDIKKTSARYRKFSLKYGDRAHELETLPTAERQRLLTEAIDSVIDIGAFNRELDNEREDAARLATLRETVVPPLLAAASRMTKE